MARPLKKFNIKGRDLADLSNRMAELAAKLDNAVNDITKDAASSAVANVAKRTPVDVGTARSNWIASLITPSGGTRKAFSPFPSRWRPVPGMFPGGPISETRNQAGTVWSAGSVINSRKPGQVIYITNNLPYIGVLNSGSSKQAPGSFVQAGVRATGAELKNIARKHLKKL